MGFSRKNPIVVGCGGLRVRYLSNCQLSAVSPQSGTHRQSIFFSTQLKFSILDAHEINGLEVHPALSGSHACGFCPRTSVHGSTHSVKYEAKAARREASPS